MKGEFIKFFAHDKFDRARWRTWRILEAQVFVFPSKKLRMLIVRKYFVEREESSLHIPLPGFFFLDIEQYFTPSCSKKFSEKMSGQFADAQLLYDNNAVMLGNVLDAKS